MHGQWVGLHFHNRNRCSNTHSAHRINNITILHNNVANVKQGKRYWLNCFLRRSLNLNWNRSFAKLIHLHLYFKKWQRVTVTFRSGSDKQLLLRYAEAKRLAASRDWSVEEHRTNGSRLELQYRVVCAANYYGQQCMQYCRPKDDEYGHYICTAQGVKQCKQGWQGDFCDKREFLTSVILGTKTFSFSNRAKPQ